MTNPISRTTAPPPSTVIRTMVDTMAQIFRSHLPPSVNAILPRNVILIPATKWILALALYYHSIAAVTIYLLAPYLIDPLVATLSPHYQAAQSAYLAQTDQADLDRIHTAAKECPSDDASLKALIKSAPIITAQLATILLNKIPKKEEKRRKHIGFALISNHEKTNAQLLQAIIQQVPSLTPIIVNLYPLMSTKPQHQSLYALSPEACTQFMAESLLHACPDERERRLSAIHAIYPQHPLFTHSEALLSFITSQTGVPPEAIISLLCRINPTLTKDHSLFIELARLLGEDVKDLYRGDQPLI